MDSAGQGARMVTDVKAGRGGDAEEHETSGTLLTVIVNVPGVR